LSIAIDYSFEVIVIGQLEHNVVGNCNWYFCNRLPITSSMLCQRLRYLFRGFSVKPEECCMQKGIGCCPRALKTLS